MTGLKLGPLVSEETALPTEPNVFLVYLHFEALVVV